MNTYFGMCEEYQGGTPIFVVQAPSVFSAVTKIIAYQVQAVDEQDEGLPIWLGDTGFVVRWENQFTRSERETIINDPENIHIGWD